MFVRGKGEGGGRQREGHHEHRRGTKSVDEGTLLPGDACQRVEELKTIAGGAVYFAPPPIPEPSTTIRTGRGGAKLHTGCWAENQEKGIGRQSAGGLENSS